MERKLRGPPRKAQTSTVIEAKIEGCVRYSQIRRTIPFSPYSTGVEPVAVQRYSRPSMSVLDPMGICVYSLFSKRRSEWRSDVGRVVLKKREVEAIV